MKKFNKTMAVILVFVLLFGTIVVSGVQNIESNENKDIYLSLKDLPQNIYTTVVDSIEEKYSVDDIRIVKSNSLHDIEIDYPDGNATSISFAVPIKYIDLKGSSSFIDTSFQKTTDTNKQKSGFNYQNVANSFNVYFSAKSSVGFNFNDDFEFSVLSAEKNKSEVKEDEFGNGKIIYDDAFGSETSLEYINTTRGLKSNIIIDSKKSSNEYCFKFTSKQYLPILSADKRSIQIVENKNLDVVKYYLPEIYMYDSSNETHISDSCFYDIVKINDCTYTIKIVVSKDYLYDSNTVYPITIDPSIVATQTTSNIEDSFTSEGQPSTNYGDNSYMRIGYYAYHTSSKHKMYSYIKFKTLPFYKSYISKFSITSAYLKLYLASGTTTAATGKIYRAKKNWSEDSITWNNQPNSFELTATSSHNDCQYYNFKITSIAKKWYDRAGNYGVKVTYNDLTHNDFNLIHAADGSLEKAPKLTINYKKAQKNVYTNTNQITNNSSYNREVASEYAEKYGEYNSTDIWDTPSYKSTSTAPSNWIDGGNNCTNFVSQCLHEGGMLFLGNLKNNNAHWYYDTVLGCYQSSHTWGGASNFYNHWGHDSSGQAGQRTYITVRYETVQDALYDWSYIRETFEEGDVIQHINGEGNIHHSMILYSANKATGEFLYAQHSGNHINLNLLEKLKTWNEEQSSSSVILHRMK